MKTIPVENKISAKEIMESIDYYVHNMNWLCVLETDYNRFEAVRTLDRNQEIARSITEIKESLNNYRKSLEKIIDAVIDKRMKT